MNDELRKLPKRRTRSTDPRKASEKSQFLSRKQVLELVPISTSTLYVMISKGEFPHQKKLGSRAVAWSKDEVNAWIKEKLSA